MKKPIPFSAAAAALLAGYAASAADRQPNVIIIYADDMGYADLSCYGEQRWTTANLDRLAAEGVRFTDFYSASPVSSPSRAALMTGRYPARMGIQGVFFPDSYTGMPQSEVTMAELLAPQGYRCAIVGKWHLGHHRQFLPLQQGFHEYFGIPYSNDMSSTVYIRDNEVEQFHVDQTQTIQTYTREAVDFIGRNAAGPFFLYLAHNMVHVPIYVSKAFEGRSGAGKFGDAVLEMDWSVGEVMAALERNGVADNTIVIFSSDNGPWLQEGPLGGTALPLREGKGTDFEGGMRVPCIAWWKGHFPARTDSSVACMLDWFPTLARLCSAPLPEGVTLDGCDISELLQGTGERADQRFVYMCPNRGVTAIRDGDWKLTLPAAGIEGNFWRASTAPHDTLLLNLREDVGERTDYSRKYPQKTQEMAAALEAFRRDFGPTPPRLVQNGNNQMRQLNEERAALIEEAQKQGMKSKKEVIEGFRKR